MKVSAGGSGMVFPLTPVWIIGSYDPEGRPNMMAAAWVGVCCSKPRCLTASLRRATHSYESIMSHGAYTASLPSTRFVAEADYVGIFSGRDGDKFDATGLTAVRSDLVDAPYVGEFPVVFECRLVQALELGSHTQFIGEVVDVKVDQELLHADGMVDMTAVDPFVFAMGSRGSRKYYALGREIGDAFAIGRTLKKE
jgi:flavin reductase (DIM6/NTAB) family NADH-FMN oxidoreductase RutF